MSHTRVSAPTTVAATPEMEFEQQVVNYLRNREAAAAAAWFKCARRIIVASSFIIRSNHVLETRKSVPECISSHKSASHSRRYRRASGFASAATTIIYHHLRFRIELINCLPIHFECLQIKKKKTFLNARYEREKKRKLIATVLNGRSVHYNNVTVRKEIRRRAGLAKTLFTSLPIINLYARIIWTNFDFLMLTRWFRIKSQAKLWSLESTDLNFFLIFTCVINFFRFHSKGNWYCWIFRLDINTAK